MRALWAVIAVAACDRAPTQSADAALAGDAGPVETLEGVVEDTQTRGGIVDARVCIAKRADIPCAIADARGRFSLDVPEPAAPENLGELVTADGYLGELFLAQAAPAGVNFTSGVFLEVNETATAGLVTAAGFTYPDAARGYLAVDLFGPTPGDAPVGATVAIAPASGAGPVYSDADGTPDPALAAATTSRAVLFGNVAPGLVHVTVAAPGLVCTADAGGVVVDGDWAPTGGGATLDALVVAGALTNGITVFCR